MNYFKFLNIAYGVFKNIYIHIKGIWNATALLKQGKKNYKSDKAEIAGFDVVCGKLHSRRASNDNSTIFIVIQLD